MRIAMISYHTCPLATLGGKDTGGMNVYVRDLTKQLGAFGITVDVFTRSQDEHVPHVLHELGYGNRVVHVPAGPEHPLPKSELITHSEKFVEEILNFSQRKNIQYDIIHSHYWMSGIAALNLKKRWGTPIVHMFHTLGKMKQRVGKTTEEREGDYRINGEREVIKGVDRIIAATPAEFAQLQWLYNADVNKISIIPPGVDTSHFYPIPQDEAKEFIGIPRCQRMILFVGRVEPLKGLDTLLRAVLIMRQNGSWSNNPFCLAIVGGVADDDLENSDNEQGRINQLREDFGLKDLVIFLGNKSQDTLPYYYSAAEIVVMPSTYESFGMVALEAMACGTPVVASNVGGLAYLVKDEVTGFTVPVEEPETLATRINELISDKSLRNRMSEEAVKFAMNYRWESIAQQIMAVYDDLIKKNH
ncbi:MAG: glycosyltransferase [Anaerolineales bacterium]